ncbi:DeoR family transcriptional regulator, aga operon transcriptional repressor/DeoR family transcriptional regulator, myo-inositol catabolism operon repressor [Paenibacillus catalpae]|uniref:DeoR family transcriptional regulator, aga operon transcriptional repressor/DeoR family transcriptional regulator, myo-inositol catabolism operon repressor n=1 Tax=Paenibacillus catalpae TaxID=1045775 RepID=A0A1I2F2R9_9BACL|nr:DeoR/GlpR family DNA-binding transcription regulator [Paenibacillus catalpae]SFE98810.1 DeoR family transcriptional regulator, aga operon transcriptional repressor/DeoR family transcriptional regulator, myo-inositol catabolism operon repressor [Paenibacillus catalpae]
MIASQRRNVIKEMLLEERSVKVVDLAKHFNVSEETIRRDLLQLEQEGFLEKNYGGAVLAEELQQTMSIVPPVNQRKFQYYEEKDAIAKAAASLIKESSNIILDSGSTTWCVARHLKQVPDLTIVTNGINIAEECSANEERSIFLIGGKLIRKSMCLVGPQAEDELRKYDAHYAILGTSGISMRRGFMSSDLYEAQVKRAMISAAQKVIVVADHSKFLKNGFVSFSAFQEIDVLITSELADMAVMHEIEQHGVQIIVCPIKK